MKPSEKTPRKFEETIIVTDWEVLSHDGWKDIHSTNRTVKYQVYQILLENGRILECADDHILIDSEGVGVFAAESLGSMIKTDIGVSVVVEVIKTGRVENMYDLSVSGDHLYYTNGVLSHNTTTFSADVLHDVIFNEDYRVGITSYRNDAVLDFMDRIRYSYENLPWWLKPAVTIYNRFSISFDNGSSIRSQVTAENTFRGKSMNRIISDELAFTKPAIADEFIASLLPSLEGDGENSTTKLNIISTPKGTEGAFPSIWFGALMGENGFTPIEVVYEEIPNRTPEFEEKMIKKLGRDKFEQEYKNRFIGSGGTLVSSRIMESIKTKDPVEELGDLSIFVNDLKGRTLAIACDVAEGVNEDNHAMQIFDIETFEQVGEFANNTLPQTMYFKEIVKTVKYFFSKGVSEIFYTVENNGLGQGIMRLIENSQDNGLSEAILISDVNSDGTPAKRMGMMTTGKSKLAGCMQFKDLVETGRFKINSKRLLTEMKFFVKSGASFAAEKGAKDDRVMACVVLCNMLPQLANYEDSVHEAINDVSEDEELWGIAF